MALNIKDGSGTTQTLATGLSGSDLVPVHAISGTVSVTGTALTASLANSSLIVTSSQTNPVYVTGNVSIANTSISVTSSQTNPVVVKSKTGTTSDRAVFTPYEAINYTGSASGTFEIASASANRIGLMISNPSQLNLYISIGDDSYAATNGFYVSSVSTEPQIFSFIIYPSGTYFADPAFVTLKHGGFFVSSSNVLDQAVARVERIT